MIIVTTENIAGMKVVKALGMVKGNTIRARHLGRDIAAIFRGMIGGEIVEYTKMMAESREQSIDRMVDEAKQLGANAITSTRFSTSSMMQSAAELVCYGTAVIVEDE